MLSMLQARRLNRWSSGWWSSCSAFYVRYVLLGLMLLYW